MAICVYESGNTTIRNGLDPLETCTAYVLLEPADYDLLLNGSGDVLSPDSPEAALLIGATIGILALAWVIRQVLDLLSTNPNRG